MARLPTTSDAFSAIAEPKRRAVIEFLLLQELTVNQLVDKTGWSQPMVSKHLGVLKEVGLVSEHREGRCRIYSFNALALKPVQDWLEQFAEYWNQNLDQLGTYLAQLQNNKQAGEKSNE